jgi:hypothetical protein
MINIKKVITVFSIFAVFILLNFNTGCKKDENTTTTPRSTTYPLKVHDVLGVSGTVKFTETSTTSTTIDITLTGAPSGTHPAELFNLSAVEGGSVLIVLNPVDASGKSSTVVTTMTYSQLIAYDGHIDVRKSESEYDIVLARGDIGGNVLTGASKSYTLSDAGSFGVTGTALFEKRSNGNTLVTLTLNGIINGDEYPATINVGSVTTAGPVTKNLSIVTGTGTTGTSYTNIRSLEDGTPYTYDQWLVYTGYINIYQNSVSTANIICHGNIGSN